MKLLTKELEKKLTEAGIAEAAASVEDQRNIADKVILAKFFYPCGYATWYATEYLPEDRVFFGFCAVLPGGEEWGYFSLDELQSFRGKFGLGIERDMHFTPCKVRDCRELQKFAHKWS